MATRKSKLRKRAAPKKSPQRRGTGKRANPGNGTASLRRELAEAREHQRLSAEVLGLISRSTFDLQDVLDTLTASAARLCRADMASISRQDAAGYHHVTNYGFPADWIDYNKSIRLQAGRGSVVGRSLLEGKVVQVADVLADPEYTYHEPQRKAGYRSFLAVPLLRDGSTIGVLSLCRKTVKPFTAKQIELLTGFATQAVIAIENARLFDEVQARTDDLRESLQQQTATADVLKLISRSTFDLPTVLQTLLESAVRLCDADFGNIARPDNDGFFKVEATYGTSAQLTERMKRTPMRAGRGSAIGRALQEKKTIHIHDALADPEYEMRRLIAIDGFRTLLGVPLLREDTPIGVFSLGRRSVRPFTEKQIELATTFADQAAIAIENVRLFNEVRARTEDLREALQQQTATADVLKLISRSAFDLPTVLSTLLETAARLSEADFGNVAGPAHDDFFRVEATYGTSPEFAAAIKQTPMRAGRGSAMGRALQERTTVHILDAAADPEFELKQAVAIDGFRTLLGVPLLREDRPIGVFAVGRRTVRPFTEKQIELVSTFADQAAIAIENVRLFNETREALERQTATAEILRVISSSPTDTQPVFDAIVQSGLKLFPDATIGIALPDGDQVKAVAVAEPDPVRAEAWRRRFPFPLTREYMHSVAILDASEVDVPDVVDAPASMAAGARNFLSSGYRAVTIMPMMRGNTAIGVLSVVRLAPGPLTENQRAMLKTFADQAVIAIENTRLLNELRQRTDDLSEALEQQTAIGDILKAISSSPGDVAPVFRTVVECAARICEADIVDIILAGNGTVEVAETYGEAGRPIGEAIPLDRATVMGRSICDKQTVHIADLQSEGHEFPLGRELALRYGHRTILAVPLIREGEALGTILVRRLEVRPFEDKHIALLTTFADQAAIAIENARLVIELRRRTDDLTEALQQQTATGEILASISASPTDARPVFDAIVRNLLKLFGTRFAVVQLLKDGIVHMPAADGQPGFERLVERYPRPLDNTTAGNVAMLTKQVVQYAPVLGNPLAPAATRDFARDFGFDSVIFAPMLRGEAAVVGAIGVAHHESEAFDDKQVALIQAFADQAVIAIENARLFEELQARTEDLRESLQQQTATADVLKVISRSAFDLQVVLDTLVESATHLCGADLAWLFQRHGDVLRWSASYGTASDVHARIKEYFLTREVPLDRTSVVGRSALDAQVTHLVDVLADPSYGWSGAQQIGGYRAALGVPLMREGNVVGVIFLSKAVPEAFSPKQIDLATTFADQAVIAIENARLFDEVQARTEDLRESLQQQTATADVLKVISRSAVDLETVLQTLVESAARLSEADSATITRQEDGVFYRAETFGFSREFLDAIRKMPVVPERSSVAGRALLEGKVVHIPDILKDPEYTFTRDVGLDQFRTTLGVPMLREGIPIGVMTLTRKQARPFSDKQVELVSTFADQAAIAIENSRLFEEVQSRTRELSRSLEDLRLAQDRLVQTEKLASLGQLTAGIAHEIKNPLNFVNNFSAISAELIDELNDVLKSAPLDAKAHEDIDELTGMLKSNLEKVVQHGKRADSIVKNMLLHSRHGSGEYQPADINAIVEESLNLAYHGARAERTGFNITLQRDLDPEAGTIELYPQEITRVFLNLISNGFYAATKRKEACGNEFEPTLSTTTRNLGDLVEIRIRDNGTGIPDDLRDRIFNPFFTTKPAGEGTGLGLSMSHDIIVKQHGGSIAVDSSPNEFTEFVIRLPRTIAAQARSGGAT